MKCQWLWLYPCSLHCLGKPNQVGLPGCTSHYYRQWACLFLMPDCSTAQMSGLYRCLTNRYLKPEKENPNSCLNLTDRAFFLLGYPREVQFCLDKLSVYKVLLTSNDSHSDGFSNYCRRNKHYFNEQCFQECWFISIQQWCYGITNGDHKNTGK